jgi:hypothetical protein
MPGWREQTARHARLAEELRLPVFERYTPLWAAVDAMLAGRYDDVERLSAAAEEAGMRAGDRNAELFAGMVRFCAQLERGAFDEIDIAFVEDKIANSPAGISYRGSYAWVLAGLGETERARQELRAAMALPHAFDANWLSLQAECAETSVLIDDAPRPRRTLARVFHSARCRRYPRSTGERFVRSSIGSRSVFRGHPGAASYLEELSKREIEHQARVGELRRINANQFVLLTDILVHGEAVSPGAAIIRLEGEKIIEASAYLSDPEILAALDLIPGPPPGRSA